MKGMLKFKLPDGNKVQGRSYRAIVAQMAHEKLRPVRSQERYRKAVARRVREMTGIEVDTSTDKAFVQSMVRHDLMRVDS
jgi:uncharacterized protein (DUF305 family)